MATKKTMGVYSFLWHDEFFSPLWENIYIYIFSGVGLLNCMVYLFSGFKEPHLISLC